MKAVGMALKRHTDRQGQTRISQAGRFSSGDEKKLQTRISAKLPRNGAPAARKKVIDFEWVEAISEEEWDIYRSAITTLRSTGVPFLLGGGFALAIFTGRWRDTKDIDFYIHPRDREVVIAALHKAGFADYYSQLPYDRKWIYRSVRFGVIVDIIWAMANQRAQVDEEWFNHSIPVAVRGETLQVVPMEEFLWCKLYIMQRDHCDWTDIFNLVYANGENIEWKRVIARLKEDTPLLRAMLHVYSWLCPKNARELPARLWKQL